MEVQGNYNATTQDPQPADQGQLSQEELQEFLEFKRRKEAKIARDANLSTYRELVDEAIDKVVPCLIEVSGSLKQVKTLAFKEFNNAIKLKQDMFKISGSSNQKTYTFTNSDSTRRVVVGYYLVDAWLDTVNDGIEIVTEWLKQLGNTENEKALVAAIMRLLERSASGSLNAKKVMELRSTVGNIANERVLEGIELIEKSYAPEPSKSFVRVEIRDENGKWINVPLNMTEV